jgi:putative ABC transport system substrate-binding protein
VASFARPGGNVTGFTILGPELEGKRLEILKEAVPGISRVGVIWNSANPPVISFYRQTQVAAASLGVTLHPVPEVRSLEDLKNAFVTIATELPHALIVLPDRFLLAHRKEIANFAATAGLPAMYPYREYVSAGGLMAYAVNNIDQFRRTAIYVSRILKGAKPEDLPVQNPLKFELIINLSAAKALGINVSPTLLLAIELKSEFGRLTMVQRETIAALERAGAFTAVCRGLDAALHRLEAWGLLRR